MLSTSTMGDTKDSRGTKILGSPLDLLDETESARTQRCASPNWGEPEELSSPAPSGEQNATLELLDLPGADENSAPLSFPEPTPRPPNYVLEEISQFVREALARYGIPGDLEITASQAILNSPQGKRRAPIDLWVSRWPTLDDDSRRERTGEVARRLAQGRQASPLPVRKKQIILDFRVIIASAAVIGLFIFLYIDARRHSAGDAPREKGDASQQVNEDGDTPSITRERETTGRQDSVARDSRVCAATHARVVRGGSVGLTDTDGWLVEVALVKQDGHEPLNTHPGLSKFVEAPELKDGSRYVWPKEKLSELETANGLVKVSKVEIGEASAKPIPGVVLTFSGALVDAYFDEASRSKYFHIANELAQTLQATHAAVYARCFDDSTHALGSWFLGHDAAGASTALLYFMGTYARPLHIAPPFAHPPGESELNRLHAFKNISESTTHLDRASLATLLGSQGGMATGKPDAPVIIHFPFRDGNRAARASRAIARVTSLSE